MIGRTLLFSLLLPSVLGGQEAPHPDPSATLSLQIEPESSKPPRQPANAISQELDYYIKHTASVKPNPLLQGSLFNYIPDQVTAAARWLFEWETLLHIEGEGSVRIDMLPLQGR